MFLTLILCIATALGALAGFAIRAITYQDTGRHASGSSSPQCSCRSPSRLPLREPAATHQGRNIYGRW